MVMEWEYNGNIHGDMSHYITNNLQFGVMGGKWMAYGYKTYKTTNSYKDTRWLSWDITIVPLYISGQEIHTFGDGSIQHSTKTLVFTILRTVLRNQSIWLPSGKLT